MKRGARQNTRVPPGRRAVVPAEEPAGGGAGLRPAHLFTLLTLAAASAVAVAVRGSRPENVVLIAVTVGAAGLSAFGVYRTLWPLASAATRIPEMVGGRTRAALEREKGMTLRAIKDLEFDRAMGKVSEADVRQMTARLRARAVRIMQQLDAGGAGYREIIEREIAARRLAAGLPPPPVPVSVPGATSLVPEAVGLASGGSGDQADSVRAASGGRGVESAGPSTCTACGTTNDADARFCKHCGGKLGERV